jgi:transcriptional regulator with XRE-family HTH domain
MRFDHLQILRKRKLLGWSQQVLAQRSGIAQTVISRVERGENQSPKTYKKLAKALDLKMDDLLVDDNVAGEVVKLARQISELVGTRD